MKIKQLQWTDTEFPINVPIYGHAPGLEWLYKIHAESNWDFDNKQTYYTYALRFYRYDQYLTHKQSTVDDCKAIAEKHYENLVLGLIE